MKQIRCIFLDMGKVLVDFDFKILAGRMTALTGCDTERLRSAISGNGLVTRFEMGQVGSAEFHSEFCRKLGKDVPFEDFASAWSAMFLPAPILSDETLSALAAKAGLWVLSNTNQLHFEFIAGKYDFLRHFTGRILSYEAGAMKPDPKIFACALEKAKADPGEALFVDDNLANAEAAAALGIDAFQFLSREQFEREMKSRNLL